MFSFILVMNNLNNVVLNIHDDLKDVLKVDAFVHKKMTLLFNAVEKGWTVKKVRNSYIFTKKHENKKEVFSEEYLTYFLSTNMQLNI